MHAMHALASYALSHLDACNGTAREGDSQDRFGRVSTAYLSRLNELQGYSPHVLVALGQLQRMW